MSDEYHRPKKPYTINIVKETKPKQIMLPNKNNENNKLLHQYKLAGSLVRIHINNKLCSDDELSSTYEGKIKNFDDFTIHLQSFNGEFLINKSAICLIEFLKVKNV